MNGSTAHSRFRNAFTSHQPPATSHQPPPPASAMSTKQLCSFFFTVVRPGDHKCNICDVVRKQAPKTGYSNLMSHLCSVHPTHGEEYAEFQRRNLSSLEVFGFVDQDTGNMFDWLRWIVERHLPLSEVENKLTQQLVKMRPTSATTLKFYMQRVATRVGTTIAGEMGESFGLMFDGWSSGVQHYVGVFAVYHAHGQRQQRLIGLSPMNDGFTADAHIEHLDAVLDVYGKTLAMVKFLVGDNCSTNQSIATKMGVPLIGCASHRYNLAVQKLLSGFESEISQIQNLMIQLRYPNNAAELARYTELRPVRCNATRWSSVHDMIKRYVQIREAIMNVADVEELVPRGPAHRRITALMEKLGELDSVTVKLQYEHRTLADVRALFDACLEKYPVMAEHLKASAKIVHSPAFENAVVKLATGGPLTESELEAVAPFKRTSDAATPVEAPADFATEVLRRVKKPRRADPVLSDYVAILSTIPPTSNRCERLFSECKYVLSAHRSSMKAAVFEQLMFLKANRDLWSASSLLP